MVNTLLSKKKILPVAILLGGLLIALGVFISANFASAQSYNVSQWTEETGAGISTPACSSAAPSVTCVGNKPKVTLSWAYDTRIPSKHGECVKAAYSIWSPGIDDTLIEWGDNKNCTDEKSLVNLANNTPYSYKIYWVTVTDIVTSDELVRSFTTPNCTVDPPATPNLSVVASCSAANVPQATLSWTVSSVTGISNYHIERCRGVSCTAFLQINTSTTSPYTSPVLATSTTYRYRVRSHSHTNTFFSPYSNVVTVTMPASCVLSPDLTAGATTAMPSPSIPGESVSFSSSVSNIGTDVALNFHNIFQVSNSSMTSTIVRVDTGIVPSLAVGSSTNISGSHAFVSSGTYNVRACANMLTSGNMNIDIDGESDVTNNCGLWTIVEVSSFDYSLSNSGTSNVTKASGNAFTTNTITKTLLSVSTQSVTLDVSGEPSGVTHSISNQGCSPTCTSVITFTVPPSTPNGTYLIRVTGSPLNKQTSFNLVVSGNPMSVSCSSSPKTALVGELVTWTASVSGGTPPLSYSWSGTNIPTSPAPTTNPFSIRYSTIGPKTATITVTDTNSVQASCPSTIQINFNPLFEEF
ncbi:MAG: CARDB domain-containing protein [bacterium]|nr:CARDB domain-containing protein [bacterium]